MGRGGQTCTAIKDNPLVGKKKLLLALALCAVLAGATAAVVTAAQPGSRARHDARAHRPGSSRGGALAGAAGYLGVSPVQLRGELRSGKSLAQIATATPGKSPAGLVQALVTADKARLAGQAAGLSARITAQVDRVGHRGTVLQAAAHYLGLSRPELRGDLRSGHTLAQLANATPGKSEAGLVEALVAARKSALASEVNAGAITRAQADAVLPALTRRVSAQVARVRHLHRAHQGAGASAP
jgi:hypothetical protein